jgi:O-antigen/teichoic acid export membrane protein
VVLPSALLAALSMRELRLVPHGGSPDVDQRGVIWSILREAAPLAGAILLVSLYTRIDVVFVSAAEDAAGYAQYLLAFRFVEQLIVVAAILAGTLLPMLAARATSRSLFGDEVTHQTMLAVTTLGGLSSMALIAVAKPLIGVVGPDSFGFAAKLLMLLSPIALALYLNFFLGYLLMAIRKGARYLWLNAFGLAFNLAANAALTLPYGNVAAARITWVTELLVVAFAIVPFAHREGGGRWTVARCAALAAVAIGASEAAYAGVAPVVVAVAGAAATLAIGGRALVERLVAIRDARPLPE